MKEVFKKTLTDEIKAVFKERRYAHARKKHTPESFMEGLCHSIVNNSETALMHEAVKYTCMKLQIPCQFKNLKKILNS